MGSRFLLPDDAISVGWRETAARLGIAQGTLHTRARWCRERRLWVVRPPQPNGNALGIDDATIARAYAEAGSVRRAAALLHCSWSLVAKRLAAAGVPRKAWGRPRKDAA